MQEMWVLALHQEDPLEQEMATHSNIPIFLPKKFHEQRSLAGYSPWGCKEQEHNWANAPCNLILNIYIYVNIYKRIYVYIIFSDYFPV